LFGRHFIQQCDCTSLPCGKLCTEPGFKLRVDEYLLYKPDHGSERLQLELRRWRHFGLSQPTAYVCDERYQRHKLCGAVDCDELFWLPGYGLRYGNHFPIPDG